MMNSILTSAAPLVVASMRTAGENDGVAGTSPDAVMEPEKSAEKTAEMTAAPDAEMEPEALPI